MIQVETAREMQTAINKHFTQADVVIMAAAVCDYSSAEYFQNKVKKNSDKITLKLVRTPDILAELGRNKLKNQILVGFAAETENILVNAKNKLSNKNLDLLVLNEISPSNPAFGSEENQVYLIRPDGIKKINKMDKARIAALVWDEIRDLSGQAQNRLLSP